MLNFHFTRNRKTHAYSCEALRVATDGYNVRYDFKDGHGDAILAADTMASIFSVLEGLPYKHGVFHFPEYSFYNNDIHLSGACVFQNVSSLDDARVTFRTELSRGVSSHLLPHHRKAVNDQHQTLDLLLDATVHVLNINVLQLQRLRSVIDPKEATKIEEQHAEMLSLLKSVANVFSMGTSVDQASLNARLATMSLENFCAEDVVH